MKRTAIEEILNGEGLNDILDKYKYFPFELAMNDDADLQFILGVRGDGKTHNAKKAIVKDWFLRGIKSYWIIPHKNEMEEMIQTKDWHLDLLIDELMVPAEEWDMDIPQDTYVEQNYSKDDIECHHLALKISMRKEFLYDTESNEEMEMQDWFVRFIPLSMYHKYKKGRHPRVNRLYFDEFMREDYLKNEAFKVMDLITSIQREKKDFKVFFMGNAISLNHPLFVALNVFELEEEKVITVLKDSKGKLGKIWRWKRREKDAEDKNGEILWYRMGDITGYNDYAVNNNFKNDNVSNIIQFDDETIKNGYFEKVHTFKIEDIFLDCYKISKDWNSEGKDLYWFKVNKKPRKGSVEFAITRESVEDGIPYKPNMAIDIAKHIMMDRIWYDSIVSKQYLYATVKTCF